MYILYVIILHSKYTKFQPSTYWHYFQGHFWYTKKNWRLDFIKYKIIMLESRFSPWICVFFTWTFFLIKLKSWSLFLYPINNISKIPSYVCIYIYVYKYYVYLYNTSWFLKYFLIKKKFFKDIKMFKSIHSIDYCYQQILI